MTSAIGPTIEADAKLTRFVGRQPILDSNLAVYGHELLFRAGVENAFSGDSEQATQSVIDSALLLIPGLTREVSFINCTRKALLSGIVTLLPAANTVLEILEHIQPDSELLACCRDLRKIGYRFALDDFFAEESRSSFLEIADYIKIDFLASDKVARRGIYKMAADHRLHFIAEKVESAEDVKAAASEGCELFQGYFFCRPMMVATQVIPQNHLVYLRLLAELARCPTDLYEVERLVMSDTSICYRLLRLVNSVLYALPHPVASIRSALLMIGEDEFRKVVTVALANVVATKRSKAATRVALERAKFCELLSPYVNQPASSLYLMGMLSLIDVVLGMPMQRVMDLLPLDDCLKATLLGRETILSLALDLVRHREAADWHEVESLQLRLGLAEKAASSFQLESARWADSVDRIS